MLGKNKSPTHPLCGVGANENERQDPAEEHAILEGAGRGRPALNSRDGEVLHCIAGIE